ncbi:MAG: tryptophan synthase subunit beta like protein [Candidatus Sedimenticola endophacoides]
MPYVKRDEDGDIVALFEERQPEATERLPPSHDDVLNFLLRGETAGEAKEYLSRTDTEMVRIVEDLIDLLIQKNLILLTDLPQVAQNKLLARKHLRDRFRPEHSLLVDEGAIL